MMQGLDNVIPIGSRAELEDKAHAKKQLDAAIKSIDMAFRGAGAISAPHTLAQIQDLKETRENVEQLRSWALRTSEPKRIRAEIRTRMDFIKALLAKYLSDDQLAELLGPESVQ